MAPVDAMDEKNTKEIEAGFVEVQDPQETSSDSVGDSREVQTRLQKITIFLKSWGVEVHGIDPVPEERRTDQRLYQMFFVWLSANLSVLTFSTGTVGPVFFGLGMRDSLLIILVGDILTCTVPAYFGTFGPKLGTRAMVQARYSWGFYGAMIPSILNVFSLQGFLILNTIVGGQTLAAVSSHLNATLGIVIISVISLIVTFLGYRVLHLYESVAWFPNLVAFLVMLGVGAKDIKNLPPVASPSAATVLSYGSIVFVSVLSWCTMTPDYGVYHSPKSTWRVFVYVYLGFLVGGMPGHMLGAAFAAGASAVPEWQAGLGNGNDVGGLVGAVLFRAGGFGRFLTALVALTIPSAVAPTMYSFGTSLMTVSPWLARVPRYLYGFVATAVLIPVAIVGATRFYETFNDILSIIGYWSASYAAIVMADHTIIRRSRWSSYDTTHWNDPRRLPLGLAAVLAFLCSIGIIVPCMSQVWYTGPIAAAGTGDISMFTGFVVAAALYVPLRMVERVWERRVGRGETGGAMRVRGEGKLEGEGTC